MFSKVFWFSTIERALKTFAQSLLAIILGDTAFNVLSADYTGLFSVAATATVISVLTSLVSAKATDGTPSLAVTETRPTVDEEV